MKRWSWAAVCAAVCVSMFASPLRADILTSTFEETNLANNLNSNGSYEGLPGVASQFRSGAVTFANDGVFFSGTSWSGVGYSRQTTQVGAALYNNSNDLIARPAVGAGGSATWGVVGGGGSMKADNGYVFLNVDLTSTLYTWNSIANGDPFSGPSMRDGGGTGRYAGQDDFFTVRFTNTATSSFLDFNLADYRGSADNVVTTWQPFNLLSLGANELAISFIGSRETNYNPPEDPPFYFLDTPAYVAMDNLSVISVTAVPEPSSGLLLLAALPLVKRLLKRA